MRISVAFYLVFCTVPLLAQQSTARLLGTVLDPTGGAVAGAAVTVTNVATSQTRSVQTTAVGEYSISLLSIGEYTMKVEAPGFANRSFRGIVLKVDQEARFDVNLVLGSEQGNRQHAAQWARVLATYPTHTRRRLHAWRLRYQFRGQVGLRISGNSRLA